MTHDQADHTGVEDADLLHGLIAIARFLKLRPTQAKHWAAAEGMPVFRIGRNVCARRSTLRAWLAEREAAAKAASK